MNNTLLKGLALLELLSHSDHPMTLTQIAAALGIVKSNTHRLVQALRETGYITRDDATGAYSVSIKLWELGSAGLCKLGLRRHAELQMEKLLLRTGETVYLSVLDGFDVVYLHKIEGINELTYPARMHTHIGGRVPAYCVATGKVQLAQFSDRVLLDLSQKFVPQSTYTVHESAAFLRQIRQIRKRGYAVSRGERRDDIWGIAAPIFDARGLVIAAIGVSAPASRLHARKIRAIAGLVMDAASEISHALGRDPRLSTLTQLGAAAGIHVAALAAA